MVGNETTPNPYAGPFTAREIATAVRTMFLHYIPDCGCEVEGVFDAPNDGAQFLITGGGWDIVTFSFNHSIVDAHGNIQGVFSSRYIPDEDDPEYGEPDENDYNIQIGGAEKGGRSDFHLPVGEDIFAVSEHFRSLIVAMLDETLRRLLQRIEPGQDEAKIQRVFGDARRIRIGGSTLDEG